MKMSNKKFMKIAANLGISTALLTGCVSDIDESNSLATDQDTTNDVGSQKQCSSNQVDENGNECFEEIPKEGPVNHANNKDKQDNPSIEHDNGWSSALVPFAAGAAGMMLANSLNKKNPGHINNNNNHTYRPPMTQRPTPEAPKEQDKGRGSNTSAVTSGGGASNKGNSNKNNSTNTPPSTNKNGTNDKVNLNKDSANNNNTSTPRTNNPNQPSKPSTSSKVSSGSSGIGNAKAPAGS
ncbi:hypothetical protein ACPCKQ_28935 [Bacillus bombysepticus]